MSLSLACLWACVGACGGRDVDADALDGARGGDGRPDGGPAECEAGRLICSGAASVATCAPDGSGWLDAPCEGGTVCRGGVCVSALCVPGERLCAGRTQVQECGLSGQGWEVVGRCPQGSLCDGGECLSACDVSTKAGSYLGCEYWAADLDNVEEAEGQPVGLAVSVGATGALTEVDITLQATGQVLSAAELGVSDRFVSPGQVKVFKLPAGWDVDGSGLSRNAFKLTTTSPVTVHQFNPLNGQGVYSNDASLLLPAKVLGRDYLVMSWPHRNGGGASGGGVSLSGFVAIIATGQGQTLVRVTPTANVQGWAESGGGDGVEAIAAGTTKAFVLNAGDLLNLETAGDDLGAGLNRSAGSNDGRGDLTGTRIIADQQITVIAGHECANVPVGISACDHIEEQLLPVNSWGSSYVADPFASRSGSQTDLWRVMAGRDGVVVTTEPPVPGYERVVLQRGSWVQFASRDAVYLAADGPIMVGHYLTGSSYPGADRVCAASAQGRATALGDPAFTLVSPISRFLKEYTVLTPGGYAQDWLNLVAPAAGSQPVEVSVDGVPVSQAWERVGASSWSMLQLAVEPGVHKVTASAPVGLTAYGYDCDVSYAYPGGLRLRRQQTGDPPGGCAEGANGDGDEDEDAAGCVDYFIDGDGDGAGAAGASRCLCAAAPPYVALTGGDCDDGDPSISPLAVERCDGADDNCNLIVDDGCDDDGDGFCDVGHQRVGTPDICPSGGGDCQDYWASVNPGAAEVPSDGVDNDCDGVSAGDSGTLEPQCAGTCTGGTVDAMLCAAEICFPDHLLAASVVSPTGSYIGGYWTAMSHWGAASNDLGPRAGGGYAAIGTGSWAAFDHNALPGSSFGGLDDPYSDGAGGGQIYDAVEFRVVMRAPQGVTGFSIDYLFMSAEYEEFIGSVFNDRFYILLRAPTTTGNATEVINYAPCRDPQTYTDFVQGGQAWCYIAINSAFSEPCSGVATQITGTGYGCFNGSSTGWLSTRWPIEAGEVFELIFHIHDTADDGYDSHVILDNFRWEGGSFEQGTVSHH